MINSNQVHNNFITYRRFLIHWIETLISILWLICQKMCNEILTITHSNEVKTIWDLEQSHEWFVWVKQTINRSIKKEKKTSIDGGENFNNRSKKEGKSLFVTKLSDHFLLSSLTGKRDIYMTYIKLDSRLIIWHSANYLASDVWNEWSNWLIDIVSLEKIMIALFEK